MPSTDENNKGPARHNSSLPPKSGDNHLLLIAIDEYEQCPRLYNCVKDSEAFAQVLHQQYQFAEERTARLHNQAATRPAIMKHLGQYVKTLGPDDQLVIYFSGHGIYDEDRKEGFWAPVNGSLDATYDCVANQDVLRELKAIKARHVLLVVDSCFSGTLFARQKLVRSAANRLAEQKSRWAITAGRKEPVLDGAPGMHSPFAQKVLQFLQENTETSLMVSELAQFLKAAVGNNHDQIPEGLPLRDAGDEGGEFVFQLKAQVSVEEQAFEAAQSNNTLAAWNRFIQEYPDSPKFDQALEALQAAEEKLEWEKTQAQGTLAGYHLFVKRFGKGTYATAAKERIAKWSETEPILEKKPASPPVEAVSKPAPSTPKPSEAKPKMGMLPEANQLSTWVKAAKSLDIGKKHLEEKQYDKALSQFKIAAKEEIPEANFQIALLYLENKVRINDKFEKAFEYFEKAVNAGHSKAYNYCGLYWANGWGKCKVDLPKAVEFYQKGVAQGDDSAQNNLGYLYMYGGKGLKKDPKKAIQLMTAAAKNGNDSAQNNLGMWYLNGEGVKQDFLQACKWFETSAKSGNENGQFNLGYCYLNGLGYKQDKEKAVSYFRKAAEQKNISAFYYLGVCYRDGSGVKVNYNQAFKWFNQAADYENADALNALGYMYMEGMGLDAPNYAEALDHFEAAVAEGNADGANNLGWLYLQGLGVTVNHSSALKNFKFAAENGSAAGMINYGHMHEAGLGAAQNFTIAKAWYEKATHAGSALGWSRLAQLYEKGAGVEKNYKLAEQYYNKAIEAGETSAKTKLEELKKKNSGFWNSFFGS
jgi:hypothetical protein